MVINPDFYSLGLMHIVVENTCESILFGLFPSYSTCERKSGAIGLSYILQDFCHWIFIKTQTKMSLLFVGPVFIQ